MMSNLLRMSLRDFMAGQFAAVIFGPSGAGLGEPNYQGRTADESKPPGWTPNPGAWDPYSRTPGGDPFYSALNTAARQTQEPWNVRTSKDSATPPAVTVAFSLGGEIQWDTEPTRKFVKFLGVVYEIV